MSTPEEAVPAPEATPTPPDAVPPADAEPEQPVNGDDELKAFITEVIKATQLPFAPGTFPKAIVVSSETTAVPPTCTVQFPMADGGAGESVAGVRYFDHYTPVAGDTVILLKQGTDITALGQINDSSQGGSDQGWATAGSSVQYRKVVDNGDFKIQLKGTWTGSGTTLFTLPDGFRPSATRTILCGRDGNAAGIRVQITTGGTCTLVGGDLIPDADSTTPAASGSTTPAATGSSNSGTTGSSNSGTTGGSSGTTGSFDYGTITDNAHTHDAHLDHSHSHGGAVANTAFSEVEATSGTAVTILVGSHTHSMGSHTHTGGDHTHEGGSHTHTSAAHTHTSAAHTHTVTLALPGNVYFDGKEFFL